jgi:PAS domain S-box-containing protein
MPHSLQNEASASPEDLRRVLQDLHTHQIELEMQNEELRRTQLELEASHARYFDLYDQAPVGYVALGENGLILKANLTAATLLGVDRGSLVHQPLTRHIFPADQDIYYKHRKALFETGTPQVSELRLKKKDGSLFWGRINSTLNVSPEGSAVCRAVVTDITSRKQAQEALNKVNEELEQRIEERTVELNRVNRALLMLNACDEALMRAKNEPDLLNEICRVIVKNGGALIAWIGFAENDAAKSVRPVTHVGGDAEYLKMGQVTWADTPRGRGPTGTAIRTAMVDQCRNIAENARFALWKEAAIQRGYGSVIALPLLWKDQCLGALTIYSPLVEGFNPEEVQLLERLVDDIAFGLVALRAQAGHRHLQNELLRISEREKQIIAQELHDGLCQNLAGIAMMSLTLHESLARRNDPDAKYASKICELLNTSVNEARNLSHGLHPVGPDGEGLMNALSQLAGTVRNLFHIDCTFDCPRRVSLENETVSTHLFRITQECINNARKHGEADRVIIGLHRTEEGLTLTIEDNGVGMPKRLPKKRGMGLEIMNHRASEIGASLTWSRAKGNVGTVVKCTVPA